MPKRPDPWKAYLARFPGPRFDHYARGALPLELADRLRAAVLASPVRPISNEDAAEGASWNRITDGIIARLNVDHAYREPIAEPLLEEMLAHLKAPVAEAMGTPWRLLNLRAWTTKPGAEIGPCKMHLDGDLLKIAKIMVYLTECGGGHGGLEMDIDKRMHVVTGPPGQWCVFRNSVVHHRGIPPESGERVAIEITIAPADEFDLRPRFLGHIARYPLEP